MAQFKVKLAVLIDVRSGESKVGHQDEFRLSALDRTGDIIKHAGRTWKIAKKQTLWVNQLDVLKK